MIQPTFVIKFIDQVRSEMIKRNLGNNDIPGLSRQYVSYLLSGKGNVGVTSIIKLANALDMEIVLKLEEK